MRILILLSAFILSACGGGGEGSPSTSVAPSTSTAAFALNNAATNIFTNPQTFNVAARTQDGRNFSATIAFVPQADEVFEGQVSKVAQVTLTLRENNVVISSDTMKRYFSVSPLLFRGATVSNDPDNQNYLVSTASSVLPASANVGSNGPLVSAQYYANSSKTTPTGTEVITYSLEPDTGNTAFFCANSTTKDSFNIDIFTQSECYKITPAGAVRGLKINAGYYQNGTLQETLQFQ